MKRVTKVLGVFLLMGLGLFTGTASGDVVGYFKFDTFPGGGTTFTDDSGRGLMGILGHPFTEPGSAPGPSGEADDFALSLDGRAALVVDDSAEEILNILEPPITLEAWVRASENPLAHTGIISYGIPGGRTGAGGYKLGINPTGNLLFTLFGVVDVNSTIPFPFDGEWHHIAASYSLDDGGVVFYLDGLEVEFIAETRAILNPGTRHLDIGAQHTALGRLNGDIDRVRISTAALTEEELDSVADTVKPVGDNTVAFFDFDEGAPPYQGEGMEPAGTAISTAEWIIDHPLMENMGDPAKVTDTPSGATGDLALQFAPTGTISDMAVVWDPDGVLNVTEDWTLEAWVNYPVTVTSDRAVVFYYGYPGHGYSVSINYAEGDKLQVTTLGIADMPSDTAVVDFDIWQHIAIVHRSGESITYYINGEEAGSQSYTGGIVAVDQDHALYIGAEWDGALPFTGLIDRIRISDTALSPEELDSDPANPTSVQAWSLH